MLCFIRGILSSKTNIRVKTSKKAATEGRKIYIQQMRNFDSDNGKVTNFKPLTTDNCFESNDGAPE